MPNEIGLDRREDLKQALSDEAELDVAMIGGDLSADGIAVVGGLAVQVLVAADAP